MANPEHLAVLKMGVETWNQWREETPNIRPELEAAILRSSNLVGADLRWADLREANLSGADVSCADLSESDLSGADLTQAILCESDLSGAKLSETDLTAANISESILVGADLTRARVVSTVFADVDLSEVKGLGTVIHRGPSSIGIDTIYNSNGKIPHIFLRGAGIPEFFIENMAGLVGTGIEFYSLFISYSTKDKEFAERLYADLQVKGVRCWKDDHDMQGGKKVHEQIDRAIQMHDKLLLILSPASMASEWVRSEIFKAREREVKESRRILFPIRLCSIETLRDWKLFDADTGKDLAREIREYHIPDFSNWKDHDSYQLAFDRLLRDLQGEPKPASS